MSPTSKPRLRYGCLVCGQRFPSVSLQVRHKIDAHGYKPKRTKYGARYTKDEAILAEIVRRQVIVNDPVSAKTLILGPSTAALAKAFKVTVRAIRFRVEELEKRGFIKRDRVRGTVTITPKGVTHLEKTKGAP